MIKENATICFFGDSITAQGFWIRSIWQELCHITKRLYNCGVPGDSATMALKRIYSTCLCYNPDYVIIMFGMNDIRRELYLCDDKMLERKIAISDYEKSINRIVETVRECGSVPILITPTPYDEVSHNNETICHCNSGIDQCVRIVKTIGARSGVKVIDFNKHFNEALKNNLPVVSQDRIHPTEDGHKIMADVFMSEMNIKNEHKKISEQNLERFKIESKLTNINFVQYCFLSDAFVDEPVSIERKKKYVKEKAEIIDNDYVKNACGLYLENIDNKELLIEKLIEFTLK